MIHMENELKETEDLALHALTEYERADKQRTELYYQAKNSNALAAKTLMESLSGDGERCKALAKQRKVQGARMAYFIVVCEKRELPPSRTEPSYYAVTLILGLYSVSGSEIRCTDQG